MLKKHSFTTLLFITLKPKDRIVDTDESIKIHGQKLQYTELIFFLRSLLGTLMNIYLLHCSMIHYFYKVVTCFFLSRYFVHKHVLQWRYTVKNALTRYNINNYYNNTLLETQWTAELIEYYYMHVYQQEVNLILRLN